MDIIGNGDSQIGHVGQIGTDAHTDTAIVITQQTSPSLPDGLLSSQAAVNFGKDLPGIGFSHGRIYPIFANGCLLLQVSKGEIPVLLTPKLADQHSSREW